MKNNTLAALFISTALVIPGFIASNSNPANAEPTQQQTQEVLETPNEIDNSSGNSAVKNSIIESYIDTPIGKAEVNVSLPEKRNISNFLNEANCLVQNSGLNPLSVLPVLTPRLNCAGTNYRDKL
ncbi:hypothetical protein [Calothrix sp. CCY 0018]|uniref:hypothetical protein n=1 Tax=Calothrix sp. CCY 0018 TaxID=3103864 RepID=UPI0039C7545F